MRQRIILVTSDKALAEAYSKACEVRSAALDTTLSIQDARKLWQKEDTRLVGVVADSQSMREVERRFLMQLHLEPGAPPLIFLDAQQPPNPAASTEPVLRLHWPLDQAAMEGLRSLGATPMIFLTDPTLHLTGMLQGRLQSIGLQPMILESTVGAAELLKAPAPPQEEDKPAEKGWTLKRLIGGGKEEKPPEEPSGQPATTAVIVLWKGDVFDAEIVDQRLKQDVQNLRMFLVSSMGCVHAVERAMKRSRPGFLPRAFFGQALDLLLGRRVDDPRELGRVLYCDNFKPSLVQAAASLMADGYEVTASMKAEEAIELAQSDRYHIAVVGAALAYAQHTGIELAQKMREFDPDMRMILMVDRYPLQAALQGVSQVVEVGLDDALLKPVEPSRLKFSISRALERRRLLIENARLLEELQVTNQQLEQLNSFQSKFFATVAHDVKNPLTAIRGYAELLSWKIKEVDLLKCVNHIMSSSKTLEALISDLVDFAAIESGKLRIIMVEMDISQVVADVRSRVQVVADKRQINFQVLVPEGLPKFTADPLRIGQVIQNLCTNAIQYTPEKGAVYLHVSRGPTFVTVSVRDTGIGISKEDLPKIFNRFFQAQNAQQMRRAGFGLGLKIAQEIVKAHGGGMGVDSELGKGSVFYFTLPIPTAAVSAAPPPGGPPQVPGAADRALPRGSAASEGFPGAAPALPTLGGPFTPPPRSITPPPRTPPPTKI
ncbi:MAG: hybrid sensor histidine kinase/response regulator [Elusimicrobia bacterium]|nr:hybrid sensor histidine kinase/response regulator [Elusimicrobiota bacterium]